MKIVGILKKIVEMHRFKKTIIFFCEYIRMVIITVQAYKKAGVHTITVKNKKLFWVKKCDVQKELGIKNVYDLARIELCGIFETKNFTEEQKRKYIRTERAISKVLTDNSKF